HVVGFAHRAFHAHSHRHRVAVIGEERHLELHPASRDRRALRDGVEQRVCRPGPKRKPGQSDEKASAPHAISKPWFLSGSERTRLPVAAKRALHTAGAIAAWPGSPTPPQKPPEGASTTSTFGISRSRIMR